MRFLLRVSASDSQTVVRALIFRMTDIVSCPNFNAQRRPGSLRPFGRFLHGAVITAKDGHNTSWWIQRREDWEYR